MNTPIPLISMLLAAGAQVAELTYEYEPDYLSDETVAALDANTEQFLRGIAMLGIARDDRLAAC